MDETEIDLRAILGILRRRVRLIAVTFAFVVGAALLVTFVLTPKYTASALILVDTSAKDLLDPTNLATNSTTGSARVDSEVEILKADNVMLSVVDAKQLISDREFGVHLGWRDRLLAFFRVRDAALPLGEEALHSTVSKLKKAASVHRVGLTHLISISLTANDPIRAAEIANAIAGAYIADQVQSKISNTLTARDILQNRITAARKSIVAAEDAFDGFITQNIDAISRETGRTDISLVRDELESNLARRAQFNASADQIKENLSSGNWLAVSQSLGDEALGELVRQRAEMSGQLSTAATGSTLVVNLREELARLDADLQSRAETGLSTLRQSISAQQAQISDLRSNLRSTLLGGDIPADALTRIYGLQQNAEVARTQYQTLITRVRDLDAQSQIQIADSRIVSAALPPANASFPNTRLLLVMAGLSGLGLGVGLAFLYENVVGGFVSEAQIESVLKLPVATAIPVHALVVKSATRPEFLSPADLMHLAPMSVYAESIRRLRANLDHALRNLDGKGRTNSAQASANVIMVSSAVPGEGKSTIALSLGRAYAAAGHNSLVIDCDLRKPNLHHYLGIERNVGLSEYLRAGATPMPLEEVIIADPQSNLAAIIGSKSSATPTDQLVSSATLGRLIAHARTVFDYVILDSPPLIPIVDGIYLANHADVVALVIKWSTTSQSDTREATEILRSAVRPDVEILGVLNQQTNGRGAYNRRYAAYYGHESA